MSRPSSSSAGPPYAHLTASSFAPLLRALDAPRTSPRPASPAQTSRTFRALAGVRLGAFQKERRRRERHAAAAAAGVGSAAAAAYTPFSRRELRRRVCALAPHTPPDATVALARAGWEWHGGARRCMVCAARAVREVREGAEHDEAEGEHDEASASGAHKEWCPWRVRGCDVDLYALPQLPRAELLAELDAQAAALAQIAGIETLAVTHPPLEGVALASPTSLAALASPTSLAALASPTPLVALALFGWHVGTPGALESTLLSCACCGRRLGLWSFTAGRALDVCAEHRAFCAYLAPAAGDAQARPAWQLRVQIAASSKRPAHEDGAQVRKLRRSEVLGKVRGMLGE